ncbi:hypothetical protein K474DRAFT_1663892, partial [Panus rudis PR-1116 ss-1]
MDVQGNSELQPQNPHRDATLRPKRVLLSSSKVFAAFHIQHSRDAASTILSYSCL